MKTPTRTKTNLPAGRVVTLEGAPSSVALAESCLELGAALRSLYAAWTEDDETPGECANTGSGADVAADVFAIFTRHGFPVN